MKPSLHETRNDLSEKTRRAMIDLLNRHLADALDLGLQAKQAHWNVKGPNFIALHELFDKVAEELEEFTDDIAERAVELGGVANGTIQSVSRNSRLKAYPLDLASGRGHVTTLSGALAKFGATARAAKNLVLRLRVRLHHPPQFVHAAGNSRKQIRRVRVAKTNYRVHR